MLELIQQLARSGAVFIIFPVFMGLIAIAKYSKSLDKDE
jgi:hypothetical protein